jgi:hypothetical protein
MGGNWSDLSTSAPPVLGELSPARADAIEPNSSGAARHRYHIGSSVPPPRRARACCSLQAAQGMPG